MILDLTTIGLAGTITLAVFLFAASFGLAWLVERIITPRAKEDHRADR